MPFKGQVKAAHRLKHLPVRLLRDDGLIGQFFGFFVFSFKNQPSDFRKRCQSSRVIVSVAAAGSKPYAR